MTLTQNLRPWACLNGGAALTLLAFLAGCGGGGSTGGIGSGIGAGNPTPTPVVTPASTPSPTPVPASAGEGEIVFTSSREVPNVASGQKLFSVGLDGSNLTYIPTSGARTPDDPAWFPGRREFVYVDASSSRGGATSSIRRANRDGSNDREILAAQGGGFVASLAVSPDGNRIAYTRVGTETEIYVVNADGTNPVLVTQGSQPSWTPDCRCLVFAKASENFQSDLYLIEANGTNPRRLTTSPDTDESEPQFSPDGRRIVYASSQVNGGQKAIYVMNADGSNPTPLTNTSNGNFSPKWTSDGQRIVFISDRDGNGNTLFLMNADGSDQRQISGTPIQTNNFDLR